MRSGPLKTTLLMIIRRLGVLSAGGALALAAACHAPAPGIPVTVRATVPAPVPGGRTAPPAAEAPAPARSEVTGPVPTATDAPSADPTPAQPETTPWLVFGDSITHDAFADLDGWAAGFAPDEAPEVHNAGVPGLTTLMGVLRLDEVLATYPDARRVGLGFGTNDVYSEIVPVDAFAGRLRELVVRTRDAGRAPMIARVPWSPLPRMAAVRDYNRAIRALEDDLGLAPGPDLYGWFRDHPDQLSDDGVHVQGEGHAAIRRLWADALRAATP